MKSYWTDELQAELPDGFVDRSTHILEWPHGTDSLSLAIQRDTSRDRKTPSALLTRAQQEFERRFAHFTLEEPPTLELAFEHAAVAFRWKGDGKALFQAQLVLELGDRLIIATASGVASASQAVRELLAAFAQSIEARAQ